MAAYRALGLLPEGSGYAETLRGFGFADGCVVLVAAGEAGSGILGTIALEPFGPANELAQDETEADVRAFAVAPQAQGQGVGRKLLLAVIECAGEHGVCRLRLCTQSAMKAAQHLYTRTGFSRTPDLDFEPVPGITLRAYELALPSNPFAGQQPDKQPVSLSLALRDEAACADVTVELRKQPKELGSVAAAVAFVVSLAASFLTGQSPQAGCRTDHDPGGKDKTARAYQALFQRMFVLDLVPAWFSSRIKRLVKAPRRYLVDPALVTAVLGLGRDAILYGPDMLGRLLDTFVAAQLRAELAASSNHPRLYHLREEQGRREVDLLIETASGQLIGIEVKAAATVTASDARHLAWLRDQTGDAFAAGIVLHTGPYAFPVSDRIVAAPVSTLWS